MTVSSFLTWFHGAIGDRRAAPKKCKKIIDFTREDGDNARTLE
jgi:hypothetical protein